MGVTIKVNGAANTLIHKGSNGVSSATLPDVCKTPTPGGPVPIPYPNVSFSSDLAKGTKTVKADGGNMCANKGSEFSRSTGDEPGTVGGIMSSTFIKESTWILYSFDVKLEGKNACRLSDKKFQNHKNTVDLQGEIQMALAARGVEDFEAYCKQCSHEAGPHSDDSIRTAEYYEEALDNADLETNVQSHAYVAHRMAGASPAVASSAATAPGGAAAGAPGDVEVAAAYDPLEDEIHPASHGGACGALHDEASERHERVHQRRRHQMIGEGPIDPDSPAGQQFIADWIDKDETCEDEVVAHNETAETYDAFLNECERAGAD